MADMTKEEVYDYEINPLMKKILEICKREKIALIADFMLDDDDLHCTSALLTEECCPSAEQLKALELFGPRESIAFSMTITSPKG